MASKSYRGGKYSSQSQQAVAQQQPTVANTPSNQDALSKINALSDSEFASLVYSAIGIQMPNMLSDVADPTQSFVFAAGLNEKPLVLDTVEFNQFLKDNNIPSSEIMSRSVNGITYTNADGTNIKLTADQILDTSMYSRLNYIGGKVGGQVYGAGTYFEQNGGHSTGYGGTTVNAVLNPATAKVIKMSDLNSKWSRFAISHPQTAIAIDRLTNGRSSKAISLKALAMGYNVVREDSNSYPYHNVIDRRALVYKKR